jgi:branched-chain amino acid transport system substrate-binding protein
VLRLVRCLAALATPLAVLALAGCGEEDGGSAARSSAAESVRAVGAAGCGPVEYDGDGEPNALIASDLPMQGDSKARSEQMVEAIRIALERQDWRAGDVRVAFQACDDSVARTGLWDAEQCRANARAYAADRDLLGVVGTYNSGCAAEIVPILNRADDGPVAMVSPGNTFVCLTETSDICVRGEPESLYRSGLRNYARVIPNDAFQGAALAELAADIGGSSFVLYAAADDTSLGQAMNFRHAAEELGVPVAGYETWDPKADGYRALMEEVRGADVGTVVLAGLTEQNAGRLIRDKVDVLGPNDGDVALIGFDGLTQQSTIDEAGDAAEDMLSSIPGRAPQNLTGEGAALADELAARIGDAPVEQFAPYAAEAAEVLLQAIEVAGGDRRRVADEVIGLERSGGVLGSYEITATGDPSVGPVTIFRAGETFEPDREITPDPALVTAARGE